MALKRLKKQAAPAVPAGSSPQEKNDLLEAKQERRFEIRLRFSRWNLMAAAALLAVAAVFFALEFSALIWEEKPTGRLPIFGWYTAVYAGLTLLGMLLCLLEVKLPEKARYGVGWGLVLLLPLGAFFAVDLINSTRILYLSYRNGYACL